MNNDKTSLHIPEGKASEQPQLSRRNFLKAGLGTLATVAALEFGAISMKYLKSRAEETDVGGLVTAGKLDRFPPGSVTAFEQEGFYLICSEEGDFLAVNARCPHLGCSVSWQEEKNQFVCPCHASSFDKYGNFESPPVPRPLDIYAVIIDEDTVMVDTSLVIKREKFETSQLTSPTKVAEVDHD
jgi:cytochrome b6-f complex iron-sulfur subunit